MVGHLLYVQTPAGYERSVRLAPRGAICTASYSTWVASSKTYSEGSVGRNVMDLCTSGITCQRAGMIYRLGSIMKRPGLVNELSMFVAYGSFPPLTHTCFTSHSVSECVVQVFTLDPWSKPIVIPKLYSEILLNNTNFVLLILNIVFFLATNPLSDALSIIIIIKKNTLYELRICKLLTTNCTRIWL